MKSVRLLLKFQIRIYFMPKRKIKVHVVHASYAVIEMFRSFDFEVVPGKLWHTADFIQFTGGSDVNPELYGELPHRKTQFLNPMRDTIESMIFKSAVSRKIPMAGICRGAQFLNVMNMGSLWQDVDGHALSGTHIISDLETFKEIKATSTHHQMMRPTGDAHIVAIASESTVKHSMHGEIPISTREEDAEDPEVVFYPDTKSLCFQPHPEQRGHEDLKLYFRELLERKGVIPCVES